MWWLVPEIIEIDTVPIDTATAAIDTGMQMLLNVPPFCALEMNNGEHGCSNNDTLRRTP
jgi:hypothetical protein